MPLRRGAHARADRALAARLRAARLGEAVGATVEVLWEGGASGGDPPRRRTRRRGAPGRCGGGPRWRNAGYTPNYLRVVTRGAVDLANGILPTRLAGVEDGVLRGEIVGDERVG